MTAYRAMADEDRDFVVSGWSSSFRLSKYAGALTMERYADVMHGEIAAILARRDTRVLVAYEPGETIDGERPFLYGFLVERVGGPLPYVYYVFVKKFYRQGRERHGLDLGHAAGLFAAAGIDPLAPFSYMFRTSWSDQLTTKIPLAEWDPIPGRFEVPRCSQTRMPQTRMPRSPGPFRTRTRSGSAMSDS